MDINELISSLSVEDIEQLRSAASSILGSSEPETPKQKNSDNLFSPDMLGNLGKISSVFSQNDNRTALLEALKPMLSEPRRQRADEAIRMLRIIRLLPLLRESGLLNGLL